MFTYLSVRSSLSSLATSFSGEASPIKLSASTLVRFTKAELARVEEHAKAEASRFRPVRRVVHEGEGHRGSAGRRGLANGIRHDDLCCPDAGAASARATTMGATVRVYLKVML